MVNGDLDSNNYLAKTNNFSGLVIYTDWDDFILEAYDFENGECIGNAVFGVSNENPEENIMKIRWQVCGVRWICKYACFCRPFKGVTTRIRICPQGCDVTFVGCEYILVFCPPSNRGNFSGGSGNGNNNNGGTGNGNSGGSGTGNNSGGSARTPAQNVNAFEEECGNVNSFEEFETELNACHLISK